MVKVFNGFAGLVSVSSDQAIGSHESLAPAQMQEQQVCSIADSRLAAIFFTPVHVSIIKGSAELVPDFEGRLGVDSILRTHVCSDSVLLCL